MITSFVEKSCINGEIIEISDKVEINHMKNSFRLQLGDKLRVVDGEFEYITEIIEITKKEILCKIIEKREDEFSTKVEIHGGIGLLKNDKMELVIQKLVEIGISKIIPIEMERTVVKIKERKDKWNIIVKESLKQCQAVKLTEIDEVKKLKEIPYEEYDLVLVPYENEEDIKISQVIKVNEKLGKVLFIVGSEGGISEKEIEYLKSRGAKIVTLGKRILRAETASIVVGGILANEI
ncbi:MAG: 16S rRNA (uracil(1498)-N(3))-methyltransferase [Fusobacteriaceae bacterium]|nr:16S rRNA (uracil(1498)-N(3))-methyltransferase [Fusobacteriaceae bacterium]MBN2838288.1 16S rRNA (uracil(1498)-N(3))-methyltransferase [Fusobacteriaceae bacterium]